MININGITIGEGCDPRGEDFLRARGAIISRDDNGYITVTGSYSISRQETDEFLASLAANAPGTSSRDSEATNAAPVVDVAPVDPTTAETSFNNSMAAATDSGAKIELLHAFHRTTGIHHLSAASQRAHAEIMAVANNPNFTKAITDETAKAAYCKALPKYYPIP